MVPAQLNSVQFNSTRLGALCTVHYLELLVSDEPVRVFPVRSVSGAVVVI